MGGPRPGACERPRRLGDGLDDEVGAGAPAEVAGQHLANLNVRRRRAIPKERAGAHDDPRRAIAALEAVLGPEGLLERMQRLAGRRDSLDRADLVAVGLDRQHEAGADRLAVDEHCAGAAHAVRAAVGCWPMRAASPGALLTGVPPTPKKPSRACDTAPAPSSASTAVEPTRAKSP